MSHKNLRGALACASLLAIASTATPAAAQQVNRIIVFGDSYADTGNALRLAGVSPASTQVYTTGRFSGGTNYVDTLSSILGVPQYNFAIGGASTTGNGTPGLPGLPFEVQEFLSGGGTLGFPAVNTTLSQKDLVAVSIGGNDSRFYQQNSGTVAGAPAAAATAVSAFQQNFNLVVARGAPTISFLAGNAASLPEIANNPAAQAVRSAYSTAFNSGVQQVLAGYAAKGSIVHYLDGQLILQQVAANPAAFGITKGLVCPSFPDPTCVINSDGYLFYGDGLHLTSTGFAIVGRYAAVQLTAPLTLQAPSDLSLDTAKQWGRTLASRSELARGGSAAGLRLFAVGDLFQRDVPSSDSNDRFEIRGGGGTLGAEYGMPGATVGIAANYSRPQVRFGNASARINAHSWQIGAYGNVDLGGMFAQGQLGYGKDHDRLTRAGVLTNMSARAGGTHLTAGAKAGYLMPFGPARIGPIVAADYARARVDGYTESGDAALTLNVGPQRVRSTTGRLGAEIRGDIAQLRGFIDAAVEHEFSGGGRTILFDETSAPIIVNRWTIGGKKQTYGRISGGASVQLARQVSMNLTASSTVRRKHGDEAGAQLGLKAAF